MANGAPIGLAPFLLPLHSHWEPDDLPPFEIEMGTVEFVVKNYLGGDADAVLLDDPLKYDVLLLPPTHLCKEPSSTSCNYLCQESLTHIFFASYDWPRAENAKWHQHIDTSWILTIRKQGLRASIDVAFLLFHLPLENNNLATVEFVCVANGIDGTPIFTPECRSFVGCHLDLFLYNVLATLLVCSLPEGAPCSITTRLLAGDNSESLLPEAFIPNPDGGDTPPSFLQAFWVDQMPQHFLWCSVAPAHHWEKEAESYQSLEGEVESNQSSDFEAAGSVSIPPMEVEDPIPDTDLSNTRSQSSLTSNQGSLGQDNSDSESSAPAPDAEGSAALLRKHLESIFNSQDPNSALEEETQEAVEVSDSDFEICKSLYEETNEFPEARFLVDDLRVDDSLSRTYDEALSFMFDIDSCLVHAATPSETALALNGVYMTISHPFSYKRNESSNRLLVKTIRTSESGKAVRQNVDMAKFPNFEIAKLWVSEHAIDFTMNLHVINEEPPSGNMVEEMELYAWNASLNCAKKYFKKSPAFQRWFNDDEKKSHAVSLELKLASTNSFEVRTTSKKTGTQKHLTPTRFSYQTGCLFLEIVWENLIAIASKGVEPESNEIRYPEEFGFSKHLLSSVQEGAVNLCRNSHTVAQAAGFRHNFPQVVPVGRPHFWSQPELHQWINQEHQKSAKRASKKLFNRGAVSSAFATMDIGINFLSVNEDLVLLINGFKAQKVVQQTTKVTVRESKSYYYGLEHPQEEDDETEMLAYDSVSDFDPFPFIGRKTSKVHDHGVVACFSFSCIKLILTGFLFIVSRRRSILWERDGIQ
jgi:hypothetical protein